MLRFQPAFSYKDWAAILVISVERTSRRARARSPYWAAAWRSAEPVPRRRALGNHEKIIQDKDHCHRARREAGIQLGEPDCDTTIQCKKNRRIIVLKPLPKKAPPPFRVAWVTVELAIGIEKRDEDINVRDGRLPNLDFASLHASLSR